MNIQKERLLILSRKFNFFKEALKNYKTSGTVTPSSRFLANELLEPVNFSDTKLIVELGPGNGAITKHILKKIKPNTHLVCFEINDSFYKELQKIAHPQLTVLNVSAEDVEEEINKLGYKQADYVVSSLPLTIIPKEISNTILKASYKILKQKGYFNQFQYSLSYYGKLKEIFGNNVSLSFELLNFPPAFIYKCAKK